MTVTGTRAPSSVHIWVMPRLVPRSVSMSGLHADVHAGGQRELADRVHRLAGGLEDVDQALVRPDLELLARLLVDVRRAQHRVALDARGQRDRTRDPGAGAARAVGDVGRRLVQGLVVVRLEPD